MPDPASTTGAWITDLAVEVSPAGMVVRWPDGVRRWEVAWPTVTSLARGTPGRYSDGSPNESLDVAVAGRTVHLVAPAAVFTADAFAAVDAARDQGSAPRPGAPAGAVPFAPVVPVGPVGRPAPTAWTAPATGPAPAGWQAPPAGERPPEWQAQPQAPSPVWPAETGDPSGWGPSALPVAVAPGEAPARHGDGRTRRVALVAAAVVVVAAAVGVTAWALGRHQQTDDLAGKTPMQVFTISQRAAVRSGSFHYVSTSRFTDSSGSSNMVTVGDAGKTSGSQQITAGQDTFTIYVVGTGVYFKGNAAALGDQLGLTASAAASNAGRWISLAPSDAPTPAVEAGVTSPDFFTGPCLLQPGVSGSPVGVSRGTIAGRPVGIVQCTIDDTGGSGSAAVTTTGSGTLSVAAAAPNLPVRSASAVTSSGAAGSGSGTSVVNFSNWGEAVSVTAPPGAIPYASLPTQPGAGGQAQLPPTTTA